MVKLLHLCFQLFRQVAAALPGMDQSDQVQKDGILSVEYMFISVLFRLAESVKAKCKMLALTQQWLHLVVKVSEVRK